MAEENKIDTEEVKEETSVLEEVKDESKSGESLISEDAKEFDASVFNDSPTVVKKDDEGAKDNEESNDGLFEWSDYSDTAEEGNEETETENKPTEERKSTETVSDDTSFVDDITGDDPVKEEDRVEKGNEFKVVAEQLGLKFDTIEELKEHLVNVEEENNKIRSNYSGGATNKRIDALKELDGNNNEELVRLSLEKEGFSGDDLTDAVDKFIDNGMLDIEAKRIRNTINKAISKEQEKITQTTLDSDATQQREYDESVRKLGEHIKETKTMFGFQMAKDEESLGKVQQGHFNYIKSGKFMDDVFKDDQSLTENAWLIKNKDTIMKAIANKNLQKGKESILNDIKNPEVETPQRFKDPKGSDEFDPRAFTYGNSK